MVTADEHDVVSNREIVTELMDAAKKLKEVARSAIRYAEDHNDRYFIDGVSVDFGFILHESDILLDALEELSDSAAV